MANVDAAQRGSGTWSPQSKRPSQCPERLSIATEARASRWEQRLHDGPYKALEVGRIEYTDIGVDYGRSPRQVF